VSWKFTATLAAFTRNELLVKSFIGAGENKRLSSTVDSLSELGIRIWCEAEQNRVACIETHVDTGSAEEAETSIFTSGPSIQNSQTHVYISDLPRGAIFRTDAMSCLKRMTIEV
jgi:hypothetical protein